MRRFRNIVIPIVVSAVVLSAPGHAQEPKKHGKKKAVAAGVDASVTATPTPAPNSQVPLPIGHEAKGLVFPDIDEQGHLRGRFVAGTAKRIDQDHMEFRDLKINTFTEDNKADLEVAMIDSTLDLNTRVLSSGQRTVVKRSDFEIVGDKGRFDTAGRQGTVMGNVKMVIKDANNFSAKHAPSP